MKLNTNNTFCFIDIAIRNMKIYKLLCRATANKSVKLTFLTTHKRIQKKKLHLKVKPTYGKYIKKILLK